METYILRKEYWIRHYKNRKRQSPEATRHPQSLQPLQYSDVSLMKRTVPLQTMRMSLLRFTLSIHGIKVAHSYVWVAEQ